MNVRNQNTKAEKSKSKVQKYWYKTHIQICVLCGIETHNRERVYSESEKGIKCSDTACSHHF